MSQRFRFALNLYLSDLESEEAQKPFAERRQIPTIAAVIAAVKSRYPESKLHKVTAYNLASGRTKTLTYETAQMLIDELWHMGFHPDFNKLFRYVPPEA